LACRWLPTIEIGKKIVGCQEAVMALRRRWGDDEHGQPPLLTGGTAGGMAMTASLTNKSWKFSPEGFTCNKRFLYS